jgi:hypothetical protein
VPDNEYEHRIVLFVDFLAFKAHVDRTVSEPEFLDRLIKAVKMLRKVGMERDFFPSQQLTHFSDSVVLSYKVTETSAVFWLLNQIQLAIINLADQGFLVRGAVTAGAMLHTKKNLVGPAMVEAYRLESTVAKYPRVLVDKSLLEIARKYRSEGHAPDEEERYARSSLIDEDGLLWLDYISFKSVVVVAGCEQEDYPGYIARLGRLIREGLGSREPGVLSKYLWLHRRYKNEVRGYRAMPPHSDPDLEAQRAAVAALPLMPKRVRKAKKIVDRAPAGH